MITFIGKVDANTYRERGVVAIGSSLSSLNIHISNNVATTSNSFNYAGNISNIKFHSDFRMGELLSTKAYSFTLPSSTTMRTIHHIIDSNTNVNNINVVPLLQSSSGGTFEHSLVNSTNGTRMLQFYIDESNMLICRDVAIPSIDVFGVGKTLPQITINFIVHYINI